MLSDCCYDQTKMLHELSRLHHFVERHALPEVRENDLPLTEELYKELLIDLDKNVEKFRQAIEGLSREGKFR